MISGVKGTSALNYALQSQPAQPKAPAKPAASSVQDSVELSNAAAQAIGDVDHGGDKK